MNSIISIIEVIFFLEGKVIKSESIFSDQPHQDARSQTSEGLRYGKVSKKGKSPAYPPGNEETYHHQGWWLSHYL